MKVLQWGKSLGESLVIAFALYSAIPMPRVTWRADNMRYALGFLPLIGLVIGVGEYLWFLLGQWLALHQMVVAVVAVIIPVAVSGGIHLDGFCDTVDALSSHQSQARKLVIMQDPHIGAFALMGCVFYLMLTFALWRALELNVHLLVLMGMGFMLSRAMGGLLLLSMPKAKKDGLGATVAQGASTRVVQGVLGGNMVLGVAGMGLLDFRAAIFYIVGQTLLLVYYLPMVKREFGGITGDLAGYWIAGSELMLLITMMLRGVWGQ